MSQREPHKSAYKTDLNPESWTKNFRGSGQRYFPLFIKE